MYKFSQSSLDKLSTCHPDLQKVAVRALELSLLDFGIVEGERTLEKQKEYMATGRSSTIKSRHIKRDQDKQGVHALDIAVYVEGKYSQDFNHYAKVAQVFFTAAIEFGVQIEWGGFWLSPKDGPHFQLSWKAYP